MRIPAPTLHALYDHLARAHGADDVEARLFADSLLDADLRAHQTQGLGLVGYMDELFGAGIARFSAPFAIVEDSAGTALVDGNGGSGHVISARAMDLAIAKARDTGIGMVTTRNSGDCGMVASFALRAVPHDMIGIAMSTGPLLVAPWGGMEAQFCTNPLSVAVPAGRADPIVIDMATSAYSMGNVVLAARDGRKLEGPWLVDVVGRYTDEPRDVILNPMDRESPMKGALLPAGPKGFGMLLIVEMLAALLSGERTWAETPAADAPKIADTRDRAAYYSQTLIAISVAHFQEPAAFHAAAERMVATLTAVLPAQGFEAVRMPGGGAQARKAAWLAKGVEVREEEWEMAMALARRRGFADALSSTAS